ncbi:helix-turn-helix domain-containing protein [Desnuesiella massiliensis]|uniref:helix-turn-helix domain-containing protein n=1 Tax=Desnuesiella massiliensis TaxID=1650662 RepID=UPI0006E408CF|nr:AraC family transcriptional regulator [Desnuesiella massiliensis]
MLIKNHVYETIDNFFLCTHMPVKAFKANGNIIYSGGYNDKLDELFNKSNVYEKAEKALTAKDDNSIFVTVASLSDINYIVCNICPSRIMEGIFIIGPYSSNKCSTLEISYKPSFCIPHLVSLLYSIRKDIILKHKKTISITPYSYYVKKAIDYINNNYTKPITLCQLSNYLNINRCYFCSIFKKETGKTFSQFLNELRIEKSKHLLLEQNSSILDIALSVGFNNQNYYTILFKKLNNITPFEFRNNINESI